MTSTRVRIAAVALAALAIPSLAGCWSGKDATTNMEATMNSGNGVHVKVGTLEVDNATLVLGPEGSKSATLLASLVDVGGVPDALTSVTINGKPAPMFSNGTVTNSIKVLPSGTVKIGWEATNSVNTYDLDVPISSYVPVQLNFERAGTVNVSLLTVEPVGQYEGIAPSPTAAPVG